MKGIFSLLLLVCTSLCLQAQQQVYGTVTDEFGEPLIGATVLVAGTTIGTITDLEGNYALQLPDGHSVLVFTYTGFENKEVQAAGQTKVNAILYLEQLPSIEGRVQDNSGQSLAGVEIRERGSSNATRSDITGRFELELSEEYSSLTASKAGYISSTVQVHAGERSNIMLMKDQATAGSSSTSNPGTTPTPNVDPPNPDPISTAGTTSDSSDKGSGNGKLFLLLGAAILLGIAGYFMGRN